MLNGSKTHLPKLTTPVTITTRASTEDTDEYGSPVLTDTDVETVGDLQQTRRDEQAQQGEIATTTWLLVLPASVTVRTGDRATINGDTYEVVGDPWRTKARWHTEATVVRTAGSEDA